MFAWILTKCQYAKKIRAIGGKPPNPLKCCSKPPRRSEHYASGYRTLGSVALRGESLIGENDRNKASAIKGPRDQ